MEVSQSKVALFLPLLLSASEIIHAAPTILFLELTFTDDVDHASQVGRTLCVFDWTGVTATGEFQVTIPYAWDLPKLYTTGEVTLTAVPEPLTIVFAAWGLAAGILARVRRSSVR